MFRTHSQYELKIPLPSELYGEHSGIRHWHAFECVFNDFLYMVEILCEEGNDEGRGQFWKRIFFSDLSPIFGLIEEDYVKDHRINLIIPNYKTADKLLQMKQVVEIFVFSKEFNHGAKEFVTSDGEHYIQSIEMDGEDPKLRTQIYFKSTETRA